LGMLISFLKNYVLFVCLPVLVAFHWLQNKVKLLPVLYQNLPQTPVIKLESLISGWVNLDAHFLGYFGKQYISSPLKVNKEFLHMSKEQRINLTCFIVLVGFMCSVLIHYIFGAYLNAGYPLNTFLFIPTDRFMDFFNPLKGSMDRDPYNPIKIRFVGGYLPLGYFIAYLFSLIRIPSSFSISIPILNSLFGANSRWALSFFIYNYLFICILGWYTYRNLYANQKPTAQNGIYWFILVFMTYPVLFALDRSNFDMMMLALTIIFICLYNQKKYLLAALFLSISISIKMYTAVYLLIFLVDKKYREIIFTGVFVAFETILSLSLLDGGGFVELQKFLVSSKLAQTVTFEKGTIFRFSSSIYTMLIVFLPDLFRNGTFNQIYNGFVIIAFLGVVLYIILAKPRIWKIITLLTIVMILLPWSSGDYRLLFLFIPMYQYFNNQKSSSLDKWCTTLFALLLIPKNFLNIRSDLNIGMVINPLLLIILFIVVLLMEKNTDNTKSLEAEITLSPDSTLSN
jgi:hypothetical protein